MSASSTTPPAAPKRLTLFLAFLKIGVLGFGGVAAWARHVLVVEYRLLTAREFAETFGVASSLPGANTVNLATMLGDRLCGLSGAGVALLGLIGAPLVLLSAIAALYARFGNLPDVKSALHGSAAAAAGIVLGTSLKLLRDLEPDPFAILACAGVGVAGAVGVPMLFIVAVAIPTSIGLRLIAGRRA